CRGLSAVAEARPHRLAVGHPPLALTLAALALGGLGRRETRHRAIAGGWSARVFTRRAGVQASSRPIAACRGSTGTQSTAWRCAALPVCKPFMQEPPIAPLQNQSSEEAKVTDSRRN